MNQFLIDGDVLTISQNYLENDSFEIISSPSNYFFEWDNSPLATTLITNLLNENPKNVLLIDKKVYDLYFSKLDIDAEQLYIIDATEENKTVYTALEVISFLEKHAFTKGETLLVVGGGIIQDIGAFVGAAYKRGISWVYFPTTLLAMCDSCIGGKTGLNHNNAKNQVALFSAPTKIVLNPLFLNTLQESEIRSGLGEILKLLITGGEPVFKIYESLVHQGRVENITDLKTLILSSLYVKKAVIEKDEFEKNHRKSLNYGHTFGHALEVLANYKIPHGQAVALGIIIVNKISLDKGLLALELYNRIKTKALELLRIDDVKYIDTKNLLDVVRKDKKVKGSSVSLVLIENLGKTVFIKTEIEDKLLQEVNAILQEEF
ncbi:MAG: 3-dehydroquinate synthase [Brevinemataceae bacterium]